MAVRKTYATIVSIDYNLNTIQLGENIYLIHNPNNAYDKNAIDATRALGNEMIGYMTASAHTTLPGCENNSQLVQYTSTSIPLIGVVVDKREVCFKNGDISTVLKVEIHLESGKIAM